MLHPLWHRKYVNRNTAGMTAWQRHAPRPAGEHALSRCRQCCAALLLLSLATGVGAAQHRYVFDETVWTRGAWPSLKLRFPVENFVEPAAAAEPEGYELRSSTGTYSQLDLERLQEAGRARRWVLHVLLCLTTCVPDERKSAPLK